ncbi:hypothetical protein [Mesorhizobium sp. M0078]|uniref:hypothetical protein n=1 Tax=Mesorhizobium sp. M0078 TaxID=2956871 RepID=UPI003334F0D6
MNAASHRFADAVRVGRAEFRTGLVEDLPLPDSTFDKSASHSVLLAKPSSWIRRAPSRPQTRRSRRAWLPPEGTYGPHEHAGRYFYTSRAG